MGKNMKVNNTKSDHIFKFMIYPWIICTIGMLFYCFNYFLRVSPSVMQHDLMSSLHINAYEFGALAAFYYYAYTPMQIPVGMIYDRFGAKMVQFLACLIVVLGVGVFISSNTYATACIGRLLIGLGTAFAYIGVLKLASIWLPPNRFATIAGLTTAFGMISAIFSDKVLTAFVQQVGYKNALTTALYIGIALCLLILFFMRSRPATSLPHHNKTTTSNKPMTLKQLIGALKVILTNSQIWIIGLIGCLFYLPASVFLDLWGIPFLTTVYRLTAEEAATAVSWVFVGWIISGPSIGALSDKIKRRRLPLLISAVMSTVLISLVFYVPNLSLVNLYLIFFFLGVFCGAHPLCFALGKENSPNQFSGTAVAVTNTLIMLGGLIFQPVVGKLLDKHAVNVMLQDGVPIYSAQDYTYALSIIPIGLMISIFLSFMLKETYCESRAPDQRQSAGSKLVFEGK
jgi:MFS family permease